MKDAHARLKSAAAALFDTIAEEHPAGHQASKAARYLIIGGIALEVMIERGPKSPPNIWALEMVGSAVSPKVPCRRYPASALWGKTGKDGEPAYGRHSGLLAMPQLVEADLLKFTPRSFEELGLIADALMAAAEGR